MLFCIKDVKSGKYEPPFVAENDDVAKRLLAMSINTSNPNNLLVQYPEDFVLEKVGNFDSINGIVEGCIPTVVDTFVNILRGFDVDREINGNVTNAE